MTIRPDLDACAIPLETQGSPESGRAWVHLLPPGTFSGRDGRGPYAMPAATQTLLDDAVVNIDDWLSGEVETAFAEQEGVAFVTGNGVSRPRGFLSYDTTANAAWVPGKLGFVTTGAAGAFPALNPADVLFDLVYSLRAGYRQNAGFVMNRRTQSTIRKFKDADGNAPENRGGHLKRLSRSCVIA